jgi:PAS domain S-box-containing protein
MHLKITGGSNCVDRMAVKNRSGEGWYRAMFENSHRGIIFFDKTNFTIRESNTAFSHLLNYNPEDLRGRIFTSLLFDHEEKKKFLTQVGQCPDGTGFETRLETKEGDDCRVDLSWNPVDDTTFCCTAIAVSFPDRSKKMIDADLVHSCRFADSLPTSILIVRNGKILYANPAFLTFSGYLQDEIPGTDLLSLIDDPDQDNLRGSLERGLGGSPSADRNELRIVTKSGNRLMGLLFILPVVYSGEPAILINLVDISEKQLLEDTIQLDNERRRGIIVTVAHELRTPLQPILGYLNLLIQDPEGFGILEDTKKILERCLASVDRERQIINQMLELSVLDSGKLHLKFSKFSLVVLIDSILGSGGYGAQAEITVDVPQDLLIVADMDRLFGVIDSLLSNAVNFSYPPRKISIFYRSDADNTFHHISVQDNGTGIMKDALSSIFEPFQLADATKLSRRFDRIGLSLSMAKKIMQMHGGDITVESVPGSGSTFTLHLPKSGEHNY